MSTDVSRRRILEMAAAPWRLPVDLKKEKHPAGLRLLELQ
jgi:hypothetical protein